MALDVVSASCWGSVAVDVLVVTSVSGFLTSVSGCSSFTVSVLLGSTATGKHERNSGALPSLEHCEKMS